MLAHIPHFLYAVLGGIVGGFAGIVNTRYNECMNYETRLELISSRECVPK